MVDTEAFRQKLQDEIRDIQQRGQKAYLEKKRLQEDVQAIQDEAEAKVIAERIVDEHDISTTDYITYQSKMDAENVPRETTKDMWDKLKAEGMIDGADDIDQDELGSVELADIDPAAVQELHLFTFSECQFCAKAKERLREQIDAGDVTLQEIDGDDDAAALAEELEVRQVPLLVAETQDGYERL